MKPLAFLLALSLASTVSAQNLFPEGNFEILNSEGLPETWSFPHPSHLTKINGSASIEVEDGNHFVRLKLNDSSRACHIGADIPVTEGATNLVILYRVRCTEIAAAEEPSWSGVFNGGAFLREDGAAIALFPGLTRYKADTPGWVSVEYSVAIPMGTKIIRLQPGLYHTTGTADFDDFTVTLE